MKNAHKGMDVDNVHDMMDEIAEQQDVAKEIQEAIANPVAFGQGKNIGFNILISLIMMKYSSSKILIESPIDIHLLTER